MKIVTVEIKGKTPLLMHRFPLEPQDGLDKRPKKEQAEVAAYRDNGTGNLFIPAVNLQRGLVSGGAFLKGKGRASLQKIVAACVFVSPVCLDLGVQDYVIDERACVIPSTKGRVIRVRPRLDVWGVRFELEYDEVLMSEEQARQLVDETGSRVGLLDFRPEKKGPFGRFIVTKWESQK